MSNSVKLKDLASTASDQLIEVEVLPQDDSDVLWFVLNALCKSGHEAICAQIKAGLEINSCEDVSRNLELLAMAGEKETAALIGVIRGYTQYLLLKGENPKNILNNIVRVASSINASSLQEFFGLMTETLVTDYKERAINIFELGAAMLDQMLEYMQKYALDKERTYRLLIELYMQNWMSNVLREHIKFAL